MWACPGGRLRGLFCEVQPPRVLLQSCDHLFTEWDLILFLTSYQVQGASFRGWKEVTSPFNDDDEQHLLESRKSPRSRG